MTNLSSHQAHKLEDKLASDSSDWRIDTKVLPDSQWHTLIMMLWGFVFVLVMILSALGWWQWLVVLASLWLSFWLYRANHISQRFKIVHLTQPPFSQLYRSAWFVYVINTAQVKGNNIQLWQGKLIASYVNRYLVVLYFDITEPQPQRYSVLIWRDQVNPESWRQLQVLARLS